MALGFLMVNLITTIYAFGSACHGIPIGVFTGRQSAARIGLPKPALPASVPTC
jgi:hypothetical protein